MNGEVAALKKSNMGEDENEAKKQDLDVLKLKRRIENDVKTQ